MQYTYKVNRSTSGSWSIHFSYAFRCQPIKSRSFFWTSSEGKNGMTWKKPLLLYKQTPDCCIVIGFRKRLGNIQLRRTEVIVLLVLNQTWRPVLCNSQLHFLVSFYWVLLIINIFLETFKLKYEMYRKRERKGKLFKGSQHNWMLRCDSDCDKVLPRQSEFHESFVKESISSIYHVSRGVSNGGFFRRC